MNFGSRRSTKTSSSSLIFWAALQAQRRERRRGTKIQRAVWQARGVRLVTAHCRRQQVHARMFTRLGSPTQARIAHNSAGGRVLPRILLKSLAALANSPLGGIDEAPRQRLSCGRLRTYPGVLNGTAFLDQLQTASSFC